MRHDIAIADADDDVCLSQLWTLDRKKHVWSKTRASGVRRSSSTPISRNRSHRVQQLQPTSEDSDLEESREAVVAADFASLDRSIVKKNSSFIRKFRPTLSNQRLRDRSVRKKNISIGNPVLKSGMENLGRYNCRDLNSSQRNAKLSDKTDSDATSGLGLELHNTTSSDSDKSEAFATPSGHRITRLHLSDSTTGSMRRSNSIYDNLNDVVEDPMTPVIPVEIQSPPPPPNVADPFGNGLGTLHKDMLEQLESMTKMISDVQMLFEKNDLTLRREKTKLTKRHTIDCYFDDGDHEDDSHDVELYIPESTYDASSTRSFSVDADISESRDEGSRDPNSTLDDSGQESDQFESHDGYVEDWKRPVRTRSCRKRLRWKSFYRDHQPSFRSRNVQLNNLSAGQVMMLRKLAMLRLTSLIERYGAMRNNDSITWSFSFKPYLKRLKGNSLRAKKNIFGVSLLKNAQNYGQPLPLPMQRALQYLRRNAMCQQGLFRKSGVKTRIQKLRQAMEATPEDFEFKFDDFSPYDIADVVKGYFRDLPEPLMTGKLSQTFTSIFLDIPAQHWLKAVQPAILLLPDENREVLQTLLYFLSDVAGKSNENSMTADNLAVCFAPSLFQLNMSSSRGTGSFLRRRNGSSMPTPDESTRIHNESVAAHKCFTFMIKECKNLFRISKDLMAQCRLAVMEQPEDLLVSEFGVNPTHKQLTEFVDRKLAVDFHSSSWSKYQLNTNCNSVSVHTRKCDDDLPLKLFRCRMTIQGCPQEVLNAVLQGRNQWDPDLLEMRNIQQLDDTSDITQYVTGSMSPHPHRDYTVYRAWRYRPTGKCELFQTSTRHPKAPLIGDVRGVILLSQWSIEPLDGGKSHVTHITRFDTRGRDPKWYERIAGNQLATEMRRIQDYISLRI